MTTIAYKHGVLAGDSMMTRGEQTMYGIQKVCRTKRFLMGYSGSFPMFGPMYDWLLQLDDPNYADLPEHQFYRIGDFPDNNGYDGFALLISEGGDMYELLDKGHMVPHGKRSFYAIGSGEQFALGALHNGASAVHAVEVSKQYDPGTGGEVRTITFHDEVRHPLSY